MSFTSRLRRDLLEPLEMLRSGSPRRRYWMEVEPRQWWSEGRLLALQAEKLRRLVATVYQQHPFWRARFDAAGLDPSAIQTPRDLRLLPVLSKAEIRATGEGLISPQLDRSQLLQFKTGGSTGQPLSIFLTEELSERRNAVARRHDRWTGWEPGEPVGALWGNPKPAGSWKERLRRSLLEPMIVLDTMSLSTESVRRFARQWERTQPTLLFGHAHSIYQLAEQLRAFPDHPIRPRGILATSMMLIPTERRVIEQVIGAPVFDRYGCEEVSLIGAECERHQGLHLNVEHLVIEILNEAGEPAQDGESGAIVVTDLENLAMPLLRYRVEDVGVASQRICPCGRGLPLMERVVGRSADFLRRRNGIQIAGISLIENTLTKLPGIEQMQIVQPTLDRLKLRIVPGAAFDARARAELEQYFERLFEGEAAIEIEELERIPAEANGKFRFCVSEVK